MNICLKTYAKRNVSDRAVISLKERLPATINPPCEVTCDFLVTPCENYYLLTLSLVGHLAITCQRCLDVFNQDYFSENQIAVCESDARAEQLMKQYECVVAVDGEVNLDDIIADELYLYAPEKHTDVTKCNKEVKQWMEI